MAFLIRRGKLSPEGVRVLARSNFLQQLDQGELVIKESVLEVKKFPSRGETKPRTRVLTREQIGGAEIISKS